MATTPAIVTVNDLKTALNKFDSTLKIQSDFKSIFTVTASGTPKTVHILTKSSPFGNVPDPAATITAAPLETYSSRFEID